MLAELLIGLSLWTAISVLTAIGLGRLLQLGKIPQVRPDRQAHQDSLSDVA